MAHYVENKEQDGIELYFDGQFPDEELCNQMKAAGLRYTNYKKCWYTKTWNTEGVAFIKRYCGEDVEVPTAAPAPAKKRASTPKKKNEPIMVLKMYELSKVIRFGIHCSLKKAS